MDETKKDALATRTAPPQQFRLQPTSLGEAMEMARVIAATELCPKAYRGNPQACIVAYEYGAALGLSWLQALRSVSVINGQGALWGDAVPALILGSSVCERFHETFTGKPFEDDYTAVCTMKRKGLPDEIIRTFSVADAKRAGLWMKKGHQGGDTPWVTYPQRMLQMRARGFAARDAFPDKLSGLILAEEAEDYQVIDVTAPPVPAELPPYVSALDRLSEGLKGSIEKAFETLALAPGLRLAKLTEFLGSAEGTDEEKGQQLLDWCKDEYSKRKTGQPRKAKDENGKGQPKAQESNLRDRASSDSTVVSDPGNVRVGNPDSDQRTDQPGGAQSPATSSQAPLTAEEIFRSQPSVQKAPEQAKTALGF